LVWAICILPRACTDDRIGPQKGNDSEAAAVRADHPMSPQCGIYYFECKIISKGKDRWGYKSLVRKSGVIADI